MVRGYKRGTRWPKPHQSCRPSLPANINLWKSRLCRSPARRQQSSTSSSQSTSTWSTASCPSWSRPSNQNQSSRRSILRHVWKLVRRWRWGEFAAPPAMTTAATQSSRSGNLSWVHLFKRRPQVGMFSEMYNSNCSPHISEMPAKCPHVNEPSLLSRGILLQPWRCQTPYPRGKGDLHQPIRTQVLPCQNFQEDPYGRLFYH